MDRFNESFDGEVKIPSTSIPQILYSGYRIVKDKKSFSRLAEKVDVYKRQDWKNLRFDKCYSHTIYGRCK